MHTQKHTLSAPSLEELVETLQAPLAANYEHTTVSVVPCPDLRKAPFHLATEGLSGDEKIADVGGQPNLFPRPRLDCIYSMPDIAKAMEMSSARGSLIGAGAGPFHVVGQNCELAPNLSWQDGFENLDNQTRIVRIRRDTGAVSLQKSTCPDCALMVNLYGSLGEPGPVIKITARKRKGPEKSFTGCIRKGLLAAYSESRTVSLGGAFLVKAGKARFHVMPDFPSEEELPFKDRNQLENWLTYHDYEAPIVCLSVLHSADPDNAMGLRIEHTHCFSPLGDNAGGHYHYDVEGAEEIEYEAYFNTAKAIYRVDMPVVASD
ncbi:DUF1907-domain-containing protein [Aspergillus heteromorphus CBS 117.55]|uniref:DUF1907-domain-containing protein n=1 Tax=Aspergillus heteromorphus CBS 117.55 TaxID=1448321 RepID=A0A317WXW3_9EURO|nr:DUF1907-domain-containing protein [Aspergillus heteromorphus CBS 117.55]PWY91189.1 DUF1907-domain-containing protein [Aspergillus heteromorphus CBS 117.55]